MIKDAYFGRLKIKNMYVGATRIWSRPFSPTNIWINDIDGIWYEPSDISTLFQDVDGTIPVRYSGDPVALMLDKSGNGNHAYQPIDASRPIYETDGILHWLRGDGFDDYIDTISTVYWNGNSFYTSIGVNVESGTFEYDTLFRFSRQDGDFTNQNNNYIEEYHGVDRKVVIQRYPSTYTFYDNYGLNKPLDISYVSTNYNSDIGEYQVLPIQSQTSGDVKNVGSGDAKLSLFGGNSGQIMRGKFFGFIWVSGEVVDSQRTEIEKYMSEKTGVVS